MIPVITPLSLKFKRVISGKIFILVNFFKSYPEIMKRIATGRGYIPLLTLIAVWSMSLVVDLPGLAISPLISVIDKVFPGATHLECQLLEILPNFCIFPFILLSGKLSMSRNKVGLVVVGLVVFLLAGIAYFFVDSILGLIIVSCILGMGCGLVIPLAAGLLAEIFTGRYRLEQMGIKSGIANGTLVLATLAVGLIEGKNWHLPFVVYLLPVVPLVMSVFLSRRFLSANGGSDVATPVQAHIKSAGLPAGVVRRRIMGIIFFYLVVTISGITLSFFIPFLMSAHHMSDDATGYVSAVFYLMVTLPGFFLGKIVCGLRRSTIPVCISLMIVGPLIIAFCPSLTAYFIGASLMGFGYGALQPIFYDKASELAPSAAHSTRVLSYVMSANYIGVAVCPLFFVGLNSVVAFVISAACMAVVLVVAILRRHSFTFSVDDELAAYGKKHLD